jgi:asparagine synthase (glutamine-hydrolysing)
MCGIAGNISFSSNKISPRQIGAMLHSIQHRGPDQYGIYMDDTAALGNSRLSIIDIQNGTQPIHNFNKTKWIVFNGEIFNYPELREELLNKHHTFYTQCDTEVLLHLYEEFGPEFLHKLNGQFAFTIWDRNKKELFAARDRYGIVPFFYYKTNLLLTFASEIKAILNAHPELKEFNIQSLRDLFTLWATLPGETLFTNIRELEPGHFFVFNKNDFYLKKYWDFPLIDDASKNETDLKKISNNIREIFYDAVKIRMRADVPVGSYLSGGIDSSLNTSLVKFNFNQRLKTFGIRFSDTAYDEGKFQQIMAEYINTEHQEIFIGDHSISAHLEDVIWHTEKPLLRTAPVPLFLLSKIVRQNNTKVVITGEGADEIFGGYNIFREAKARAFWGRNPNSQLRAKLLLKLYPYIFKDDKSKLTLKTFFGHNIENYDSPFYSHEIRWNNSKKLSRFLIEQMHPANSSEENFKSSLPEEFFRTDLLTRAQYLEIKLFLSGYLLSSQGDRMAMANSVEMRLPYLDHRLAEYLSFIPSRLKIYGMNEKFLLKKTFRNDLPSEIIRRDKTPYRAPIKKVFTQSKELNEKYLSKEAIKDSNIFDADKVHLLMKKNDRSKYIDEWDNMSLSGIITTQIFCEKFIKNFIPARADIEYALFADYRFGRSIIKIKNEVLC